MSDWEPVSLCEFRREKFLFGVRARYRMAYGYWQYAVRNEFV